VHLPVYPPVSVIYQPLHATAVGLLLWAGGQKTSIDRLLQPPGAAAARRLVAANVSSVTLSADVRSWTETGCIITL